jgi:hypothetical protein
MGLAPLPHPFHMRGAAEVVAVGGFVQPTALTSGFAGLAAGRLRTIALPPNIAGIRIKECLTMLALAFSDVTSHGPASPQVHDRHVAGWKEEHGEENGRGRREKKNEEI